VTRVLVPLTVLVALVAASPARAAKLGPGPQWTTVNVCDSAGQPNVMGVRASLPGDGSRGQMFVRFTAQWHDNAQKAWLPVGGAATSPWVPAGPARHLARQAGWNFAFDPPPPGGVFLLRAVAELQWRLGGTVVRSASLVTASSMAAVMEGDPVGTSLASCTIR
jgi:hypothetical protein